MGLAAVSLNSFYRAIAALAGDPNLVRRARRRDDDWLDGFDLSTIERERVNAMARAGGMEVFCSLYRSNRLTALIRTVPAVVETLGERLAQAVDAFWFSNPRVDMQWRTEAVAFCDFVARRYPDDPILPAVCAAARDAVIEYYDRPAPTSSATAAAPPRRDESTRRAATLRR